MKKSKHIDYAQLARVYRFHNAVALSASNATSGTTIYMTATQARQLRRALSRLIKSIENESPADCTLGTKEIHGTIKVSAKE